MTTNSESHSCKVLFLAADPYSSKQLALDDELRDIEQKIRATEHRDQIDLRSRWAVRPDDVLQALNEEQPTIVQFSAHGGLAGILLRDESGRRGRNRSVLVDAPTLRHLFKTMRNNIRVVVLSACYSSEQASAIVEEIDCVIGMKAEIGDVSARHFSAAFYRAIGFGCSVQNAFDQGVASLKLNRMVDDGVPELLVRKGVDADNIQLIAGVKAEGATGPKANVRVQTGSAARELDVDPPIILWRLPRGFLLLDSLRDAGPTWSTRAFHYHYDGTWLHGTHYHASYHRSWWDRPNGTDSQLRKLRIPKGDDLFAIDALQLLCDVREGRAKLDVAHRTLDASIDTDLVTVVFDGKATMPEIPSQYIALRESGELRDFLVEIRELGDDVRSVRRERPSASMGGAAASELRKLRQEARLRVHRSRLEKDHPARQNVEEVISEFQRITRDPDASDEYETGGVVTWLDELRNAVDGVIGEVEKAAST